MLKIYIYMILRPQQGVKISVFFCYPYVLLADNSESCIIQHDLLFTIFFRPHCSNRVMCSTLHSYNFPKTKFLVFYFLARLKIGGVTGSKIFGGLVLYYF